jgi:hypothetical protein
MGSKKITSSSTPPANRGNVSSRAEATTGSVPRNVEAAFETGRSKLKLLGGGYVGYVLMILPQVHLRKPCYDFYFL